MSVYTMGCQNFSFVGFRLSVFHGECQRFKVSCRCFTGVASLSQWLLIFDDGYQSSAEDVSLSGKLQIFTRGYQYLIMVASLFFGESVALPQCQ